MKSLKQRLSENQRLKYELYTLFEQGDPNAMPPADPSQQPQGAPPPPTAAGAPPQTSPDQQQGDPNAQQKNQPQMDESGEPADQIISAINVIRSGRSFKDAPVKVELEKYLNDLDDKEKGILITFLKGLSQISSGQVPGEQAVEPGDTGKYRVVSSGGTKIQVKPAGGGSTPQPPTQEDTTAPEQAGAAPPISPKQR